MVLGGQLAGHAADHQVRAAFGGAVAGVARHAPLGPLAGDHHDLAALALGHHLLGGVLQHDVDALAVGVHDVLPLLHGLIQDGLGLVEAVAHRQDVHLAVLVHGGLHQGLHVLLLGGGGHEAGAVDALGLELGLQVLQLALAASGHHDFGPGVAVGLSQHLAQGSGSSGDHSHLALHGEHILNKILLDSNHWKSLLSIKRQGS